MKVLKWAVPVDDEFHPIGWGPVARVAASSIGLVHVWTIEADAVDAPDRPARVYGTGHMVPDDMQHLGSAGDDIFVWHVFGSPS